MRIGVVSFRKTASNFCQNAEKIVSALNARGVVVSEVLYFTDIAFLREFKDSLLQLFDVVIIHQADFVDAKAVFDDTLAGHLKVDGTSIYFLPSNVDEAVSFLNHTVIDHILNSLGEVFGKIVLKAFCIEREDVEKAVKSAIKIAKGQLKIYLFENFFDYTIEIIYNSKTPKLTTDEVVRALNVQLFDSIYSQDGKSLQKVAFELLSIKGKTLSVAESFTGGLVTKKLIENAGASKVIFESVIAYSNKSKEKRLGVLTETLKNFGAVSDQTAYEMAAGMLQSGDCDIALSTTGIAGPNLDNTQKPKGLCFVAVGMDGQVNVYKYLFIGDRERITKLGTNAALFALISALKMKDKIKITE